jgi:glycosyltransferase involved in cell wall biosynthesis
MPQALRVAIVHDWLVGYRGGEKVLREIAELFPDAPIYTLFYDKDSVPDFFHQRRIVTLGWTQKVLFLRKLLLPFLPVLIETFNLNEFDLVISTSSCVAKGIVPAPSARHLCYLHSPMRYAWDQRDQYFAKLAKIPGIGFLLNMFLTLLRAWDVTSSSRVDLFVTNSTFVRERVRRYYRRDADVIFPPIDTRYFVPISKNEARPRDYFLLAGAFVPYKRFDLGIAACRKAGMRLVVAGHGPLQVSLEKQAQGSAEFVISPSNDALRALIQNAKALIFPCIEDFGMIAVEALAAGTPVIAYRGGGAIDFIQPGVNGVFFDELHEDSLGKALQEVHARHFDAHVVSQTAQRFTKDVFVKRLQSAVQKVLET